MTITPASVSSRRRLVTTLGDLAYEQVGWMLAHEHLFANFAEENDHGAQAADVVARIAPELERAKQAGFTALVDATAVGGARRPDIIVAVSKAAGFPVVMATGLFKEPAKRVWATVHREERLYEWMLAELTQGIGKTGDCAGWIKLSVANEGVQAHEAVLLRAAARASRETGAAVCSHTVGAALANAQLDIFEAAGGDPARFIWVHTQTEPNLAEHMAFARRGAWIEYDAVDNGDIPDAQFADWIMALLDADLGGHLLLSQDRVGYNPALPGAAITPYTYLAEGFAPVLRARGVDDDMLNLLFRNNPFRAYAR